MNLRAGLENELSYYDVKAEKPLCLDEDFWVSLRVNAIEKGMNLFPLTAMNNQLFAVY